MTNLIKFPGNQEITSEMSPYDIWCQSCYDANMMGEYLEDMKKFSYVINEVGLNYLVHKLLMSQKDFDSDNVSGIVDDFAAKVKQSIYWAIETHGRVEDAK